jgi:hypothetical protein
MASSQADNSNLSSNVNAGKAPKGKILASAKKKPSTEAERAVCAFREFLIKFAPVHGSSVCPEEQFIAYHLNKHSPDFRTTFEDDPLALLGGTVKKSEIEGDLLALATFAEENLGKSHVLTARCYNKLGEFYKHQTNEPMKAWHAFSQAQNIFDELPINSTQPDSSCLDGYRTSNTLSFAETCKALGMFEQYEQLRESAGKTN